MRWYNDVMINEYIAYLKNNPKGYWFRRKLFGWGWIPATWQGWALTLGYVALILGLAFTIDDQSPSQEVTFTFLLPIFILTGAFIGVCYKKGEKPKWQWGIPSRDDQKE